MTTIAVKEPMIQGQETEVQIPILELMKGKFELSVNFECVSQEQFDQLELDLRFAVNGFMGKFEHLPTTAIAKDKVLNITNSEGDALFGKFNPTGNAFVEEIKERSARIYDMIESLNVKDRKGAMIKTAAQVGLLNVQMDAVKLIFL